MNTNETQSFETKNQTQEKKSNVLRPFGGGMFSRLPRAIGMVTVALGVGVSAPAEVKADLNNTEKAAVALIGLAAIPKAVEYFSQEEIRDRIGNVEVFISVDAQNAMKRNGLVYNPTLKKIHTTSRTATLELTSSPNMKRRDIAVQVDQAKFPGTRGSELALTYVYLDEQGRKFGDNFIAYRDGGSIRVKRYGQPIPVE